MFFFPKFALKRKSFLGKAFIMQRTLLMGSKIFPKIKLLKIKKTRFQNS